ncbi:lung adenoma susceptibility protein 2 isoform X1 [Anguilla anguilla]|uniref:lung adenoma susceptibility protein 2 isoform X1 n=1 Tax=Anguilla anguilla TaxID=7936 RepID=UPI0015AED902|nr:lung adenoma susceptibility protein 2 isoform X1 [Anguilla anguilla]XP_035245631.1 lung adenoma susceptibility protein 2 isoform X1 [Anguilla anguilla]
MSTDNLLSPESTVTSLLASSGHLKSSLTSYSASSIRYRDRKYESATEALDAYIADFQRSLLAPEMSTGRLQLPKDPVTPILSGTRFRNKDVLKEKLTDGELDFLNLPVGTQQRDPDSLSLTTDDLLILPTDGSMPVTRTSAYLTQRVARPWGDSANSRSLKCQDLLTSQGISQRKRGLGKYLGGEDFLGSHPNHQLKGTHQTQRGPPDAVSSRHYPRWLTSLKSDMDFSGVTSVPDQAYPTWLRDCETASGHASCRTPFGKLGHSRTFPPSPKAPSWLGVLESPYEEPQEDTGSHLRVEQSVSEETGEGTSALLEEAGQPTLRELRLEFAEQLASVEERDAHNDKPFRDDKIESLILKAEKALGSPSLGPGRLTLKDGSGSPRTEDILDLDRSWDNPPVTFKSPVPVGGAEDQLNVNKPGVARKMEVCKRATASISSGYSSRKHPGPVEALKQMLFSLQAVEHRVRQEGKAQDASTLETKNPEEEHSEACTILDPCGDYESAPGGQSLQRALHHLGRLKSLVDDMNDKKERELQEQ